MFFLKKSLIKKNSNDNKIKLLGTKHGSSDIQVITGGLNTGVGGGEINLQTKLTPFKIFSSTHQSIKNKNDLRWRTTHSTYSFPIYVYFPLFLKKKSIYFETKI